MELLLHDLPDLELPLTFLLVFAKTHTGALFLVLLAFASKVFLMGVLVLAIVKYIGIYPIKASGFDFCAKTIN